jgi:hypothetical protein
MDQISLLVYTNENYLEIAKLFVDEFNKHTSDLEIPKFITSNSFSDKKNMFENTGFKLIDTQINWNSDSKHFATVMLQSLEMIDTEYVLFFLEDYFLIKDLKCSNLKKLLEIIHENHIDYLSLNSYSYDWETIDFDYLSYGLPENLIMKFDYDYFYMFSVQPSIWKVSSLKKILQSNIDVSIHEFDTTNIKNVAGLRRPNNNGEFWTSLENFWDFDMKFTCLRKCKETAGYSFDDTDVHDNYLLFLYAEVIRWGRFNLQTHHNNRKYLQDFFIKNQIDPEDKKWSKYF